MPIDFPFLAGMLFLLFVPVSGACLYYAVRKDAAARGANDGRWGTAVLFLPPIAAPVYAGYRRRLPARPEPAGRTERWLGAVGIGGVTAVVVAAVVTPPDPFSMAAYALSLGAVSIPLAAVVCYGDRA